MVARQRGGRSRGVDGGGDAAELWLGFSSFRRSCAPDEVTMARLEPHESREGETGVGEGRGGVVAAYFFFPTSPVSRRRWGGETAPDDGGFLVCHFVKFWFHSFYSTEPGLDLIKLTSSAFDQEKYRDPSGSLKEI